MYLRLWKMWVILGECIFSILIHLTKHLKGQLGRNVNHDTFFKGGHVFFTKGGQLGPLLVTSWFWTKGGQLGSPLVTSRFWTKGGQLGPVLVTLRCWTKGGYPIQAERRRRKVRHWAISKCSRPKCILARQS